MFELLKLTLREKKWVTLALLSTFGVALFTAIMMNLVQPVIDEMFKANPAAVSVSAAPASGAAAAETKVRVLDLLWKLLRIDRAGIKKALPLVLIIVIFGKGLFTFFSSFFMKAVGNKVVKKMRDDLYAHILSQSSGFFDRATTGDLMSRLTNDVDRIQQAVGTAMSDIFEESFVLIGLLLTLFLNDWKMALVAFVIAPLAVIPMAAFSRQLKKQGRKSQLKMSDIYNLIHETVTGNRIVKAFTMEGFELRKFLKASWRYYRINLKLAWVSSLSSPFMEFIGGVVGAFILVVGADRIAKNQISPGDFGVFVSTIFYMFTPIKRLSRANNVVQQAVACYDRVQEVLNMPQEIEDRPDAYPMPAIQGRVRFDRVGFAYLADRPVLFDVDFETKPRETVALVGLSGAGKTTIVNLIGRFYEATSGTITIDGNNIRDVTVASLRSQIGLVTQEIVLFNDTVRANIAYGLDDVPLERIVESAKAAECHEFITELPQGYDTVIGERGGILSVGQRQRLALARALLKDPPILILDEATSALDSESERLIQQALTRIMKNRTTFVVAHRMSTIRNADTILVIDGGRIVESGSHDELVRKPRGIYRKLHDLQFPEEEENGR
ncbi:MAG: ABC transporter ATP-binding protein [Candidatus Aminicenantes bacterium]|nr:ABC transporter ATP-binding protein [Candidatus Aminicenantes bacterium]